MRATSLIGVRPETPEAPGRDIPGNIPELIPERIPNNLRRELGRHGLHAGHDRRDRPGRELGRRKANARRRRAERQPPARGHLARLSVGGIERQRRAHGGVARVLAVPLGVNLGQLAPDRNRFARIELDHRLGQQRDVLRIARRRLERALQLGQSQPRVLARDVRGRQIARDREVVGAVKQQALRHPHVLVGAPLHLQLVAGLAELPDGLLGPPGLRRPLRQPDARDDVVRVELDHLAQRRQRVGRPARLLQLGDGQLQLVQRVRHHPSRR